MSLRALALALPVALVVSACGARTGLDVLDAQAPMDATIEVSDDDGGTTLIQVGCNGVSVPSRACVGSGEDCLTTAIDGCDRDRQSSFFRRASRAW